MVIKNGKRNFEVKKEILTNFQDNLTFNDQAYLKYSFCIL
ncbi:hypothetical protein J2T04_001131 [Chryseobacterium lathyri]|uniref:Uncharacterized protein n=1 Tax=Chryseobacterium lathyri TaxID=395933 RepID=A0ABT9SIK0_9FLAO|nr:hypothetical protein [Chryseobacterium lathyri]